MNETLNIVWGTAPIVLSVIALIVAVEAFSSARSTYGRMNELEALVSRYRKADARAATRPKLPEVG